ncbi:MAG: efflux transporter outer membrane subunit [Sphingomonas sp.]
MTVKISLAAICALVLAGCTVGPNYVAPTVALPAQFAHAPATVSGDDSVEVAQWWKSFHDPQLDSLIATGLADNPDIAIAASRVRQARLQEIVARAAGRPNVGADTSASRVDFSRNAGFSSLARQFSGGANSGAGSGNGGIALPGGGITTYAIGFDASWELDLFGGARRGTESARALTEAAEWTRRDAAVTLVTEIADAYRALRVDQTQIAIVGAEIAKQERLVEIAANTAAAGLAPGIDAVRARGEVAASRARIEPYRIDVDLRIHALGILTGREPEALAAVLSVPVTLPPQIAGDVKTPLPVVPVGLPADVLRRRPDVRAAERRLAAATADIGVAVADLYPKLNLTSLVEVLSSSLGNLFSGNSFQFVGTGAVKFPLIDWGRGKARVGLSKEVREQDYVRYQAAVLGALRDVADPLAALTAERRRNAVLRQALNDAKQLARVAASRQKAGVAAQDVVLAADVRVLAARELVIDSEGRLFQLTGALFKAIGGGWSEEPSAAR